MYTITTLYACIPLDANGPGTSLVPEAALIFGLGLVTSRRSLWKFLMEVPERLPLTLY